MKRQRGGTIIGFIVGVVFGLAAALAVAVYVTKVPNPFMNRASPNMVEHDAAEARKNKDWDPNAPLAGKNAARPNANTSSGGVTDPSAAGATPAAPPSVASSSPAVNPVTRPPASSDPLGDLARAKSAAAGDPFIYYVQAGAFRTTEDAESQRAKLSLMGIEAKVTEREQAGRTVFRVRAGPFDKKDDADRLKEKLDGNNLESALVRVQR